MKNDTLTAETTDEDFGLDITILDADDQFANLMDATSDNCTSTKASACVTCI